MVRAGLLIAWLLTAHWAYAEESWTGHSLQEPYYIDIHFKCIPRRDVFQDNVMGVFWASYINAPLDKSMYFLDGNASLESPVWVQHCTPLHYHDSTVRTYLDGEGHTAW